MNLISPVSSENLRSSELFKRLKIKTTKVPDITEDSLQSIQTESIVLCGVSCSSVETCSGLQYNRETKVCRRMKMEMKVEEMFQIKIMK